MKFPLIKRTHHDIKVARLLGRLTEAKRKEEVAKSLAQNYKSTLKKIRSERGDQIRELERICEIRRQQLEILTKCPANPPSLIAGPDGIVRQMTGQEDVRLLFALKLSGIGIEIGALHRPLKVPPGVVVRYVDLNTREENIVKFPELPAHEIVETTYICDGQNLSSVPDASQDFVIANHMLEHCVNPLLALKNFLRVLKPEGELFIALPDKRFTFDFMRQVTPWKHILNDYEIGRETEDRSVYEEYRQCVQPDLDPDEAVSTQQEIHHHAWTQGEILELFINAKRVLGWSLEIECFGRQGCEVVLVLKKTDPPHQDHSKLAQVFEANPPSIPDAPIGLVAGDIVNNCNLRCPFCIVDYANVRGLKLMSRETFQRAIELLPMTQPGSFWLSCLHEPTMHPQFMDYIESVPDAYRDRISFTTNLSKNLPDDWMERLANSGIHSIRVSFDSRQPEVFAALRKHAKYETFEKNLLQLSKALQASPRRPLLHFITMAFKDNCHDIPNLVRYCRELGGDLHDIRYIYYTPHVAHWGREHVLNTTEWKDLEHSLTALASPTLTIEGPAQGIQEQFDEEQGLNEYVARENAFGGSENSLAMPVPEATSIAAQLPDAALQLRLRWDGVIIIDQLPEEMFRVNVNQLNSPPEYFSSLRPTAMRTLISKSIGRNLHRAATSCEL